VAEHARRCARQGRRAKKQGKTLEETQAAKPTADFDSKFGGFIIDGPFFTKLIFDDIK
jgi:hypothetical protein